jgi:hypothetical protein
MRRPPPRAVGPLVALLLSQGLHAAADEPTVHVIPEAGCPSQAAVAEALARLRSESTPGSSTDDASAQATVEDLGDSYRITVRSERNVADPGRRCDERARTAALVIALARGAGASPTSGVAPPIDEPVIAPAAPPARRRRGVEAIFGLGLGTAQAWLPGGTETEVAWQLRGQPSGSVGYERASVGDPGGISFAWLHLRTDVGVRLLERWDLRASLRAQVYVGANAESSATESGAPLAGGTSAARGAIAGLVRARRIFPRGPVAPFVEIAFGAGEVRPVLDLAAAQTPDKPLVDEATARAYNEDPSAVIDRQIVCGERCYDSVMVGRALAGAGAGIDVTLHERGRFALALSLSTTFLGAFGGAASGLVVDWDVGLVGRAW